MTITITLMGGYSGENILRIGGYDNQLVNEGQIWRLLTCSFGHMSYLHCILNVPLILILSRPLERVLGRIKFLLSYLFMSIFATLIIHIFSNYPVPLAGSSGVGYGLLGMYIYLIIKVKNQFSAFDMKFIISFVLMGFIMTLLIPDISFAGHMGGFMGGIILSPLIFRQKDNLKFNVNFQ
jgi:rhomboid protease GluP